MSLYLKYRPDDLSQVRGNADLLVSLERMLDDLKTCPHSFLLHGPTGCGKTTIARIIGKRLGCSELDTIEVDSADFRGIDTIREIRRNASFMASDGERRIWIIDECFAKDTLIKTPKGDVPIQNVKEGDTVFSLAGKDKVVNVFRNKIPLDRIVKITLSNKEVIICSKDHLFLTENNWQKACDLKKNTLLLPFVSKFIHNINSRKNENDKSVPHLRKFDGLLSEQTRKIQQKVLQSPMCRKMEHESSGNEKSCIQQRSKKENIYWEKTILNEHGRRTKASRIMFEQNEGKQSFLAGKKYMESETNETDQRDVTRMDGGTRGQWEINSSSNTIINRFRVENGSGNKNRPFSLRQIRVSHELQSGHRVPRIEVSDRSRRGRTFLENEYRIRCKKDEEIESIRVESIEIYERGNNEQSFSSVVGHKERNQEYVTLYDLQIHSHPSYFANGIAVHNCHKLTNDAQNALLKILEEPPSHVYFVLCTTEPQKLISTIRGRCITFQVNPLTDAHMFRLLRGISRKEGFTVKKEVLDQIVQDSMGLPRNAINILEQVLNTPEDRQIEVAKQTAEKQSQIIELCRILMAPKRSWNSVKVILEGLKTEEPETIRRVVLGYCSAVLLRSPNDMAAAIIEAFWEPTYNIGFPGVVFACYSIING